MSSAEELIPGIRACLSGTKEFTPGDILIGIDTGQYVPLVRGEAFVLLEVEYDAHFQEQVLLIFMAYSPASVKGFLADIAQSIADYAKDHRCERVIFQTYSKGYKALIDAGKQTPGITLKPYCWRYEVELT